jgi:glutamate-1-semialdehyde aminotransferase
MAKGTSTVLHSELIHRQENAIAHGALTNSKRPSTFVKGIYPTHLKESKGCYVWDSKGKKYIDFIAGLGSSILGYANEEVSQAIVAQLKRGTTFSLATELEIEAAEKVKECFPWVERVRFLKTGTEACSAAVRIARAKSGYDPIYSDGYHGWNDEFVSLTPPAIGVPKQANIIKGDFPPGGTGGLIIEPISTDCSDNRTQRLRDIRHRCDETKTPLIFDEIITGFRYPKFGVCNHLGIEPDLICLGKAIANGMPLSVVAGKKGIMECDEYFVSSTFAGETLSLAAAIKTISLLQTKYNLSHLWDRGAQFIFRFNQMCPDHLRIEGYPTRGVFKGDELTKALFFQESCKAGILFGPSFFFNFSHIDVMDMVLSSCEAIIGRIKTGCVALEGELPKTPFAQKVRNQ